MYKFIIDASKIIEINDTILILENGTTFEVPEDNALISPHLDAYLVKVRNLTPDNDYEEKYVTMSPEEFILATEENNRLEDF